jgi:hypothetical protein
MASRIPFLFALSLFLGSAVADEPVYRPFVLASIEDGSLMQRVTATVDALERAGFSIAGQHAPLANARVIVVTSPELLAIAATTPKGGYGAALRVSVTEREGRSEVAFVDPVYIQHAYRMQGDMQAIGDRLAAALGRIESYGSEDGLTAKKLSRYHYMIGMQRFDDPYELGSFDSHEAALAAVEQGLAREGDPLSLVYRIDIPGKQQTVFGVGMKATRQTGDELDIDEAQQLRVVDFEGHSKVAYFPYEILVDGAEVEALHMRFRMAVHFPDLSMMGEHGFTQLMSSPGATGDAFENLVGSK